MLAGCFGVNSAVELTQTRLDPGHLIWWNIFPAMQGNDGQRPCPAAVIDGLFDRGRAVERNAVAGDSIARQLSDQLMVVTTFHMPGVAVQVLHQVLRGPTHIEMMYQ